MDEFESLAEGENLIMKHTPTLMKNFWIFLKNILLETQWMRKLYGPI